MRKVISLMLIVILTLSLVACNGNKNQVDTPSNDVPSTMIPSDTSSSKEPSITPSQTTSIGKNEKPSRDNNDTKPSNDTTNVPFETNAPSISYGKVTYSIEELGIGTYSFEINGVKRTLDFSYGYDDETYNYNLNFMYFDGTNKNTHVDTDYGYFNSAYVIKSSDGTFAFLYVIIGLDNDWTRLVAYNITNGVEKINDYWNLDIPYEVKTTSTVNIYGFRLVSRINVLGTYMAYRDYMINSDGSLSPISSGYIPYMADLDVDSRTSIHSIQEIELYKKSDIGVVSINTTKYPTNSEFQVVESDEQYYVDLYVVATGETGRLYIQQTDDGLFEINGQLDVDIFPDAPYVG